MGKTLIIKGADFSSVAIGHVDIPKELSEKAKQWIAASGNAAMSDAQKFAVDDFISATASIQNKVQKLYLPMLANGVSKSLVNYATLIDDAPEGIFDYLDYADGGIKSKGISYPNFKTITMEDVWSNDASIFVCHTKELTPITSSYVSMPVVGLGTLPTDRLIYAASETPSALRIYGDINNNIAQDITLQVNDTSAVRLSKGVRGVMFGDTSCKALRNDGTFGTMDYPDGTVHKAQNRLCLMSSAALNGFCEDGTPYGMIVVGKKMTEEEATILKTATETLMSNFSL